MTKPLANIFTALFHPLLMATYGCILVFFCIPNSIYDFLTVAGIKWRITAVVFIFSFVFPVANIWILYRMRRVSSLTLSRQQDRTFPYLVTSLFYFGLYYLLMDVNIWPSLKVFIVGAGAAILLTAVINARYKISAHMVGLGGMLAVVIALSLISRADMTRFYILVILASGLTGWARLRLDAHTPAQIYTGFFLGFSVQAGLFFALQKMIFA